MKIFGAGFARDPLLDVGTRRLQRQHQAVDANAKPMPEVCGPPICATSLSRPPAPIALVRHPGADLPEGGAHVVVEPCTTRRQSSW